MTQIAPIKEFLSIVLGLYLGFYEIGQAYYKKHLICDMDSDDKTISRRDKIQANEDGFRFEQVIHGMVEMIERRKETMSWDYGKIKWTI